MFQFRAARALLPLAHAAAFVVALTLPTHQAAAQYWTRVPNLPTEQFSFISDIDGVVYASGETQVYRSDDLGTTWTPLGVVDPSILAIGMVTRFDGALYVGTYKSGVWRSTDEGASWHAASDGITGMGASDIFCFAVRGDSIYAGTGGAGVFVRGRDATAWTPYSDGLAWNNTYSIYTMQVVDGALVATAGSNGGVFRRPIGSPTWLDASLPDAPIPGLELVDMHYSNGLLYVAGANDLFFSDDAGETWTNPGAPFPPAFDLRVATIGSRVYAVVNSLHQGTLFYTSDDGGATWHAGESLGNTYVSDLIEIDGRLFAACEDGMRSWREAPTSVEDPVRSPVLSIDGSAPHPVRSAGTISFSLAEASAAELTVSDAAGRVHVVMPARQLAAGGHRWTWNAGDLPPGMYLCTLRAGSAAVVRPLLIVR
jgi:photosystem II stability/assembly factor-like uncharacterized protein